MRKLKFLYVLILALMVMTSWASTPPRVVLTMRNGVLVPESQQKLKQIEKKAKAGNAEDALIMADLNYFHWHNYQQAFYWYSKAAKLGDVRASEGLGLCYLNGQGVKQDNAKSTYYFRWGAKYGDLASMENLGVNYILGLGVKKNPKLAGYWWEKSAAKGSVRAMVNLVHLYTMPEFGMINIPKAKAYLIKAANENFPAAEYLLGMAYWQGKKGFTKDKAKARYWLRRAAEMQYPGAAYALLRLQEGMNN